MDKFMENITLKGCQNHNHIQKEEELCQKSMMLSL